MPEDPKPKLDLFGRRLSVGDEEISEEMLRSIFQPVRLRSLTSLQSYAEHRRSSGGISEVEILPEIPAIRLAGPGDKDKESSRGSDSAGGSSRHGMRVRKKKQADGKPKNYAGIVHSDLDIQLLRPPLMHFFNPMEWLWLQSTIKHRIIIMIMAVLISIAFAYVVFFLLVVIGGDTVENPYLCKTLACRNLARRLRASMNKSVNPCNDFYGFVCGSSGPVSVTKFEDDRWNQGFDILRITYNFHNSISLGKMLKKTNVFPDSLLLQMYKGCLQEKARIKNGLQPFYDLLKMLKLYDVRKDSELTSKDVIESIAQIISHSLTGSAIIRTVYYKNDTTGSLRAYILPAVSTARGGAVNRYGYHLYRDTVKAAFSLLTELKITPEEMEVIPHDIVCMELFFRDLNNDPNSTVFKSIIEDEKAAGKKCEIHVNYQGSVEANFGKAVNGPFDYALLMKRLYEIANPSQPVPSDLHLDPQSDANSNTGFLEAFEKGLAISAPIRILRYLQWRVLYRLSLELNEDVLDVIINVRRHVYLGRIENCFHCLFTWLPFITPNRFLAQNNPKGVDVLEKHFNEMTGSVKQLFNELIDYNNFTKFQSFWNKVHQDTPFTKKHSHVLHLIMRSLITVIDVPPVAFNAENFPDYPKLFTGISFNESNHLNNLMTMGYRMHQWRLNPQFSSTFFGIHSYYHIPVLIDKVVTTYTRSNHEHRLYLPLGVGEVPFFHDGLAVSNIGGVGLSFSQVHQRSLFQAIEDKKSPEFLESKLLPEHVSHGFNDSEEFKKLLHDVFGSLGDYVGETGPLQVELQDQQKTWTVADHVFDQFKYQSSETDVLETAVVHQASYHMMAVMVNSVLKDPANWKQARAVLLNLEEFSSKKLFYISLTNKRCEKIGPKRFYHILKYGPLVQALKVNVVLSNLEDFSETFQCPAESPMNRKDKINFYDWDWDFQSNEVKGTF